MGTDNYLTDYADLNGGVQDTDIFKLRDFLSAEDFADQKPFDIVDLFEKAKIKPRVYTICTSSVVSPNLIGIAVSCLNIGERTGLFSGFVSDLHRQILNDPNKPVYVQARINDSALKVPATTNTPVKFGLTQCLMIGNGVGIAPMRAFCQERASHLLRGAQSPFGETVVLFGTRTKQDKLFDWDFETAVKVGALQQYHIAFSREELRPKQYAQELIGEIESTVVDLILNRGGVIYVCGSNPLRKGVVEALNTVFSKHGKPQFTQKLQI